MNTTLFVDNEVIAQNNEDELQISLFITKIHRY